MTRFFVLAFAIAAAFTLVRYVIKVEGTIPEKVSFLRKSARQAVFGIKNRYIGRHHIAISAS